MTFLNPSTLRRVTNLQRLALWVLVGCVCSMGSISNGFASIVVSYDLTGEPGNQVSTGGSAPGAGVGALALARGADLNGSGGTDTINSKNWSGEAGDYFSFGFTVDAVTTVDLDNIVIRTQSTKNGPGTLGLFYSTDGFATSTEILDAGNSLFVQPGIRHSRFDDQFVYGRPFAESFKPDRRFPDPSDRNRERRGVGLRTRVANLVFRTSVALVRLRSRSTARSVPSQRWRARSY